nr:cyclin-dependent kinase 11A-like isoform X1 [Penaeus vannamei]
MYQQRNPSTVHSTRGGTLLSGRNHEEGKYGSFLMKKNRTSTVSRATAEGEALLKEMGFEDKETPGRRRTRAAIRGDVYTPPAKKERKAATPGSGRRGRPPKKTEEKKEEEPAAEEEEKNEEEEEKVEKEKPAADEEAAEEASADGDADAEEKTE